jgi:nicotinamide-nucleotide amidase
MSESQALVDRLIELGATVATAESLTGGRLAARLTEAPGSSKVFLGGVVSYATEVKKSVLGVPQEVVDEHGVVSAQCARAMAEGARRLLGAAYGVSTTGVAGPDTQEGKPPGTVYVGLAGPEETSVVPLDLEGDRGEITAATVLSAVEALAKEIGIPAGRRSEEPSLG